MAPVVVLIVDDDEDDRRLLRHVLESRFGDSVRIIESDSLSRCDQLFLLHTIDVVCLDLRMPGGDGPASVSRIRGICRNVPIIAVSGMAREVSSLEAMVRGADEYVEKSRLAEELPGAIVRALKTARGSDDTIRGVLDRLDAIAKVFETATHEISDKFREGELRFQEIEQFHEQAKRAAKFAAAAAVGVIVTGVVGAAVRFWIGGQ